MAIQVMILETAAWHRSHSTRLARHLKCKCFLLKADLLPVPTAVLSLEVTQPPNHY